MPGLGTSFGRGGATTAQQDLANADAILIIGSSMAEAHPVGFQWVVRARERGAAIIHVDPRFSRTSAMADLWVPLRAGSDIVFLGGLINYVLERNLDFREYVVAYTNAPTIIRSDFADVDGLEGLFSGWDPKRRRYETDTWEYASAPETGRVSGRSPKSGGHEQDSAGASAGGAPADRDPTLEHPRCVYQLLKRHFARYTPEMVERACGVPRDTFLEVARVFTEASGPDRTGAICYAVGLTQHSTGVQIIRAAAILQLLLGNVGRPGGGVLALRGHASIQGSTDIPTLFDILPGYLPMPKLEPGGGRSLHEYLEANRPSSGVWAATDAFLISLLKAWYGNAATARNDFGFDWLPRLTGDHSHFGYWLDMADGRMEGLFVMGQNPAVGAPNARLERRALANLRWLVVRDLVETETASFWYDSPEIERGELRTEAIATEVFLFPAAGHAEKSGCFTNTQRLIQWREKAVDPPGDARTEAWFVYHLGRRLKAMAAGDPRPRHAGLTALTWDYTTSGPHDEPSAEEVLQEINGWRLTDGARTQVENFGALKNDGTTACGAWIYSGVYPAPHRNRARERDPEGPYGHGWGFAWPADRRILYNRASARPDGRPWSERKKLVWWDEARGEWTGLDVPDFNRTKRPDYRPPRRAKGDAALSGDAPFIMHPDGLGWIWVESGLKDGPLPVHYEPLESPVRNPLYPQQHNPAADAKERPDNPYAGSPDGRYPHVLTTYRLTEHHAAGGMTRMLTRLAELQPELFCEMSPELAGEIGARHGEHVTISTPRGSIDARALVTPRIRPLVVNGQTIHQVALPFHYGRHGHATGDVVNDLIPISQEPNVKIMESKALLCRVEVGQRTQRHVEGAEKTWHTELSRKGGQRVE